jgi:hypothetical protein
MKRIVLGVVAAVGVFTALACGGGPSQSTECKDYLKCYDKTSGTTGTLDATYGASGTCWTTTTAYADTCTSTCKSSLATTKAAFPDAGC